MTATDGAGQRSDSTEAELRLDRKPPRVRVRRSEAGALRVRIVDGHAPPASRVPARSRISFGDGKRARGTARVAPLQAAAASTR